MKHLTLAAITLVSLSTLAAADPKPAARSAPTDPKLAQLVGRWEGGGTFTLEGKPIKFTVSYQCERMQIGPGISCTSLSVGPNLRYEEGHLFGYDRATDRYHLFTVNDWGEAYDHAAQWSEAAKVSFEYSATVGGKPVHELYAIAFHGANELAFHATFTRGGKVIGDGDYVAKRVP